MMKQLIKLRTDLDILLPWFPRVAEPAQEALGALSGLLANVKGPHQTNARKPDYTETSKACEWSPVCTHGRRRGSPP